jgi:hypothetical protein
MKISLRELLRKVRSGEAEVQRLGSTRVAADADKGGVASAMENDLLAQSFSSRAKRLSLEGDTSGALHWLCQSIVIQESTGNISGICSDLGNMANIYLQRQEYKIAKEIFTWLRKIDFELINEPSQIGNLRELDLPEHQLRECNLMYGLHSEGLARVYIAMNEPVLAFALIDEIKQSYEKAGRPDLVAKAGELMK